MSKLAFTVDAKTLRAAAQQGLRTRSSRAVVQVLGGLLLRVTPTQLVIESTDMDISGRVRLKLKGAKPGTALVPGTRFEKALATFTGEITVEQDSESVTISQGAAKVKTLTMVADDFPTLPTAKGDERKVVVLAPAFNRAHEFIKPHYSKEESRPVLTGVLLRCEKDRLTLAATDSYRLATTFAESASIEKALGETDPIVRGSHLVEVARLLKNDLDYVEIRRISNDHVSFVIGDVEFISRLIDGQFPNVDQLIPDTYEYKVTVNREQLSKAVDRIAKLATRNNPMRALFHSSHYPGKIRLMVMEQDVGEMIDEIDVLSIDPAPTAKRPHTESEIGWNAPFFLDGVNSFDSDDISLSIISPLRPALMSNGRDGEFFLIMPIRLAG